MKLSLHILNNLSLSMFNQSYTKNIFQKKIFLTVFYFFFFLKNKMPTIRHTPKIDKNVKLF